jgi:hypothetical protein
VKILLQRVPLTPNQVANASGWIREHPDVVISQKEHLLLKTLQSPPVGDKATKLLVTLATLHPTPGEVIKVWSHDLPYIAEHLGQSPGTLDNWMDAVRQFLHLVGAAWIESTSEYKYVVGDYLCNAKHFLIDTRDHQWGHKITPEGWAFLDQLQRRDADRKQPRDQYDPLRQIGGDLGASNENPPSNAVIQPPAELVSRRFQAHQEAYELCLNLYRKATNPTEIGAVLSECREWLSKNSLLLRPKSLEAFERAMLCAAQHCGLLQNPRDQNLVRENHKAIVRAAEEIRRAADEIGSPIDLVRGVRQDHGNQGSKPEPEIANTPQVFPMVAKGTGPWISKRIFGSGALLSVVVAFFAGAAGHWNELWVKSLIGVFLLLSGIWFCEFLLYTRRVARWKSVASAVFAVLLSTAFVILAYYLTTRPPPQASQVQIWQPPELPKDCKWIHILFAEAMESDLLASTMTNGPVSVGSINGLETVQTYIQNHRLYVLAHAPTGIYGLPNGMTNQQIAIQMNPDTDNNLPAMWDRNCNSNAFEIVDEKNLPILQVFYKRPDIVVVRGVFATKENVIIAFGNAAQKMILSPDQMLGFLPNLQRRALFRYPASLHPGELAQ